MAGETALADAAADRGDDNIDPNKQSEGPQSPHRLYFAVVKVVVSLSDLRFKFKSSTSYSNSFILG